VTATGFAPPTAVSWLAYVIIGGIAGWLAGRIVKGAGQGIILDIVVGIIGGFIGGELLDLLDKYTSVGVNVAGFHRLLTFLLALGGAVILLWLVRLVRLAGRRR
jgi:uncharacterized membrane protein YeaQ/YmgE (transglycosylase-associated protein family)